MLNPLWKSVGIARELGRDLGVTRERVRQIERAALRELEHMLDRS